MTQPVDSSNPSPQLIFETINAYQRTAMLKAGVDLQLFTAIQEGNHSMDSLAKRCGASVRGIRILADGLTMLGFLTKEKNHYDLTINSATFLVEGSPAYLGSTLAFMLSPPLFDGFRNLTDAVRKGGTILDNEGTTAEEHPEWVNFARAMVPMMIGPAKWISEHLKGQDRPVRKVLDIAAGHGVFGVEIAKVFPEATITAVDWAPVLTVARENADGASLGSRYQTIAGSAFDVDYGKGYDLVLLTNFLHHFDQSTCESLLRKIHAALGDKGRVVTLEFVPNEDRISPESADFALIMLVTTPLGDAYTFKELEAMFKNTGFQKNEIFPVPESKEHVVVSYKS